jgi:hypothetical protein
LMRIDGGCEGGEVQNVTSKARSTGPERSNLPAQAVGAKVKVHKKKPCLRQALRGGGTWVTRHPEVARAGPCPRR